MSLLTCRHLSVSYDGKAVLSDLNFSVDEGDYLGIVGENGAGKSTLVKALLRLKKTSGGEIVTADGFKPTEIGYLPQQTPVQKDFPASVWEVVLSGRLNRCGMYPFYRKSDKEDAEEKMEMLGIADLKKRCYRDLSGGQQQRVLLARALCALTIAFRSSTSLAKATREVDTWLPCPSFTLTPAFTMFSPPPKEPPTLNIVSSLGR